MFYGTDQARIHDTAFGNLAEAAAADVLALLATAGHHSGIVVDLGCGSGILARIVADAGYHVVGVDISPDMVALAQTRAPAAEFRIESLHDVRLPDQCVAVTAVGEALNYATDPRAGLMAFRRLATTVHAGLLPGGSFLFDVSGPGRAGPSGSTRQFHRHDTWCLGMIANEATDRSRLDRDISIFTVEADGRYRRADEHHVLCLYESAEVAAILSGVGYDVDVLDNYRSPTAHPRLPGWYVVEARKR